MVMPTCLSIARGAAVLAICLLASRQPVAAAQTPNAAYATRERLEQELSRLEADKSSRAAELIRARLQTGDFQAGDRIVVRVQGEPQLTDTFTVDAGPQLTLPQVGVLPLSGVLRAELPERLHEHLSGYLRDPVVQVKPLMLVLIVGEVARPGFYGVSPLQPLNDLINAAGGLTQRSAPESMRMDRNGQAFLSGQKLHEAMGRGDTFDYLNVRAGDRMVVPARKDIARTIGLVAGVAAIAVSIYYVSGGRHY